MKKYEYILNGILYQATWFLCVFYPDELYCLGGLAITLSVHLMFQAHKSRELGIILLAASFGYSMDQLMDFMNFLDTSAKSNNSFYLIIIWVAFACTLRSSFKFIFKTFQRSLALGALAPLSYFFAQKIGVVKYADPLYLSMGIHILTWLILMSFFYKINTKLSAKHE